MGTITHKAGRVAVGKAADVVIKNLDKDREKEILKLVDFMEKYMDGEKLDVDFDSVRKKIKDKKKGKTGKRKQKQNRKEI